MNRDWVDFKSIHSNIAGAREAFEDACETLFRKIHTGVPVSQVKVKQGDGGIDIFIGELGIEPITVIQCKFFLESFQESQKAQIRDSFDTAINSDKFELKNWILCLPRVVDIDEHSWWFKWTNKEIIKHKKTKDFISIKNGNELIDLFKQYHIYNQIFKIEDSIKIEKIYNALTTKKKELPCELNPSVVLFNNYSKKNEPYYLERQVDKEFAQSLKLNNIWIFGNSGNGKTALVNRNLIQNDIEFCFCDLSPTNIFESDDVLEEILCAIEDKFNLSRKNDEKNKIKQITQILCQAGQKKIIIVIDELAVKDNNVLKNIANDLINLVTHFCNSSNQEDLKFVISTISNPKDIIQNKSKASEHFQFLSCDNWSENFEQLFDILNSSLNLNLTDYKSSIIATSKNSPRILKSIFRKIIALDNLNSSSIEKAIKLTVSEIIN